MNKKTLYTVLFTAAIVGVGFYLYSKQNPKTNPTNPGTNTPPYTPPSDPVGAIIGGVRGIIGA